MLLIQDHSKKLPLRNGQNMLAITSRQFLPVTWDRSYPFEKKDIVSFKEEPCTDTSEQLAALDEGIVHEPFPNTRLFCKVCRHVVTDRDWQVQRQGSSAHTFFNPAGYVFKITCYGQVVNVAVAGEESREFSWFAGYQWQLSVCAHCQTQLGWYFKAVEDRFWGLIDGRLIEQKEKK
ncbi:cereblon family protein [Magnetococcus sp. PR-3]|uniref:cereblon family protein n=1 Tax=Magnetococcus sp. PR-3 TaxID=3120355 RepID=UPI002FCE346E